VRLFACLGASLSVGSVGAAAMAGGGVLIGFGTFKDSIVAANIEVGAEIGALGSGGIGVLLDVVGGAKNFKTKWNSYQTSAIGKPAMTKEWATKCYDLFKKVAKSGLSALAATVKGIHINGGVGVGSSAGASIDIDSGLIIDGIKKGFEKLWSSKAGSWVRDTKAWGSLKDKLKKIGESKFGQKWKKISDKTAKFVRGAVDATNEFFDYVPLTEAEAGAGAGGAGAAPGAPAPKKGKF